MKNFPSPNKRYNYLLCSSEEKKIYLLLLESFCKHVEKIKINKIYSQDIIAYCFECINKDYPELYFVNFNNFNIIMSLNSTTVVIKYHYSLSEISDLNCKINVFLSKVKPKIEKFNSRDDKLKFIYDYIAKSVEYNSAQTTNIDYNILGPIIQKKAVCEGYSKLFSLLCNYTGILSTIVFGEAIDNNKKKQLHAWNIIKPSQNECFHIDVTWESCSYIQSKALFYDYFKQNDKDMMYDHFWDKEKNPACQSHSEYSALLLNSPSEVYDYIQKCVHQNESIIKFKVTSSKASLEWSEKLLKVAFKKLNLNLEYTYSYNSDRKQINIVITKKE